MNDEYGAASQDILGKEDDEEKKKKRPLRLRDVVDPRLPDSQRKKRAPFTTGRSGVRG